MSLLVAEGLRRTFGGVTAVADVSFALEAGELVGVVGANGSGKTTTINLLTRLIPVTAGRMQIAGQDYTTAPAHRLPALGIARTFQNLRLFRDLSVWENVALGVSAHARAGHGPRALFGPSQRALRTAADQQLEALGLSGLRGARPSSLPYGVQRVVEVARALATQPRLLFLDEPFAGMDAAEAEMLAGMLAAERQRTGLTILVVDHNVEALLTVSERLLAFANGEIIAAGAPRDVLSDDAVVRSYVGSDV